MVWLVGRFRKEEDWKLHGGNAIEINGKFAYYKACSSRNDWQSRFYIVGTELVGYWLSQGWLKMEIWDIRLICFGGKLICVLVHWIEKKTRKQHRLSGIWISVQWSHIRCELIWVFNWSRMGRLANL